MAFKRRNMFYQNKKQETTGMDTQLMESRHRIRIVSVVAADVAVPGQSTAVLVSVQEPAKGDAPRPVNVTLRLVSHRSSDAPELLAQNTVPIKAVMSESNREKVPGEE
ncbi:hypothetical protein AAG570_010642 [Ranatra chinensis]|uniref:Uncharacterized protein n=1 Tax=Ranatra chinensis TaxID=642074 RepID=A0ABD0YN58_9HEMI